MAWEQDTIGWRRFMEGMISNFLETDYQPCLGSAVSDSATRRDAWPVDLQEYTSSQRATGDTPYSRKRDIATTNLGRIGVRL